MYVTSTLRNRTLKTMICMYYQLRNTYVLNSLRILLTWPQQSRHYKMQMYLHNFDVIWKASGIFLIMSDMILCLPNYTWAVAHKIQIFMAKESSFHFVAQSWENVKNITQKSKIKMLKKKRSNFLKFSKFFLYILNTVNVNETVEQIWKKQKRYLKKEHLYSFCFLELKLFLYNFFKTTSVYYKKNY